MTPLAFMALVLGILMVISWMQNNLLALLCCSIGMVVCIMSLTGATA